jgi:hypothetical protein
MAKFRLPEGSRTKVIACIVGDGSDRVVLRFNKKGEVKCADQYVDAIKLLCPNLELLVEQAETE